MKFLTAIRGAAGAHPRQAAALICLVIVIGTTSYASDHYRFHNVPTVELRSHCSAGWEEGFDRDSNTSMWSIIGPSSWKFRMRAALMTAAHRDAPMVIVDDLVLITRAEAVNHNDTYA